MLRTIPAATGLLVVAFVVIYVLPILGAFVDGAQL